MKVALLVALCAVLSCNVNDYCLNCHKPGLGDAGLDGNDGGDIGDGGGSGDGGQCIPTGVEVCDGKDNDCNGLIDDNIADVGTPCANQTGECAGAVHQCINGVPGCSKAPSPEICDGKDNDCNGLVDEGNPGGGAKCGTDVGECVAGVNHCINATVQCIGSMGTVGGQPEACNGRDDDCDGNVDEGLTNLGSCGFNGVGECMLGTLMCMGGGEVCVGDVGPTFELCDNKDNDCDGMIDEDYNKNTNPQNCGTCGHVCSLPHAVAGCGGNPADCIIASCQTDYYNNNGITADGCEYGPCQLQGPNEACNGVDDNCNGQIDENLGPPPPICATAGECAGTVAQCMGAAGWKCVYPSTVSVDGNGNIIPETLCDGKDNDCDGKVDEGQPNLGQTCHDTGLGVCQGTGTFVCDPSNLNGPATCNITQQGGSPSPEQCDGKDNDCDGVVDNGAATGNLPGQTWVTIPGSTTQIMKFEASRPDATAAAGGTDQVFACSKPGVQPWASLTYPQALAACQSIGARLCTETEWQSMCAQPPAPSYPVQGPQTASDFVFLEAEQAALNVTNSGKTWTSVPTQNFSGTTSLQSLPDSNVTITAANALAQAPRLDFKLNLVGGNQYFVWVRMLGIAGNGDSVWAGINSGNAGGADNFIMQPPLDLQWVWVPSRAITPIGGPPHTVSVFMREDGTMIDAIAVALQGATPPPINDSIWAYATNPKLVQPQTCNDNEYDTDPLTPGDQDDILPTGSLASCFANGPGAADAFDMSGNVKEWAAARSPGQNPIRGGASNNDASGTTCGLNFTLADNTFFFPNVGFRCCR